MTGKLSYAITGAKSEISKKKPPGKPPEEMPHQNLSSFDSVKLSSSKKDREPIIASGEACNRKTQNKTLSLKKLLELLVK